MGRHFLAPKCLGGTLCSLFLLAGLVAAADYRIERVTEKPDGVAEPIAKLLSAQATRVFRGTRPVFDIWLCQDVAVPTFQTADDVQFPLAAGQLVGVIRVHRKTTDFRGHDIEPGTYTLRFGLQPVDGAHVGTSPTRDFLLLLPTHRDQQPEVLAYKQLTEWSAEVSGTTHPALLCMQRPMGEEPVRAIDERGWWLVRLTTTMTHNGQSRPLIMDVVVEGQAEG